MEPSSPITSFYDLMLAVRNSSDQMTEEEIENKFTTLSLGFKTDRLTLTKRLELHQRHRDIAEGNIHTELKAIRDLASTLDSLCTDDEKIREVVAKIQNHVDVIQQSTDRVSSQAEVYGAVQQEERMSRAFEVMVTHVENLKRVSEKEHRELEEARKLLLDHQLQEVAAGSPPNKDSRGRLFSVPNPSLVAGPVRALRSLGSTARRCSLPMAHAPHGAEDAILLAREAARAECHPEEDVTPSVPRNDTSHSLRDIDGDSVTDGVIQELSSQALDENGTIADAMASEMMGSSLDPIEGDDRLNDDGTLGSDSPHHPGSSPSRHEKKPFCSNAALMHWAANIVTRLKFWVNNSRRVLAGKRRMPPITSERFTTLRYVVSGILLAAALLSVLLALLPGATSSSAPLVEELHDYSVVRNILHGVQTTRTGPPTI